MFESGPGARNVVPSVGRLKSSRARSRATRPMWPGRIKNPSSSEANPPELRIDLGGNGLSLADQRPRDH
jgi:hypothetical protein